MKFNKSQKGLIMTEALVAVAVMAMGVFVLSSVFNNATSSMRISKNYMIAQNLMIEGMEVVKNIRDSNLMVAPNNPECWLALDPAGIAGEVCGDKVGDGGGNYRIVEEGGGWKLVSGQSGLELNGNSSNDFYRLHVEEDTDRLVHYETAEGTDFYREISFSDVGEESADVKVKVQWYDGAQVRTLDGGFTLHNLLSN